MENNKKTKSDKKTLLIVLLLLVAIVAIILATYAWAKYSEQINGDATGQVAKWSVKLDNDNATGFSETFSHVVNERIAPGTSGEITAALDASGTEVDIKYTITLDSVEPVNEDGERIDDESVVVPKNLVLKVGNTVLYEDNAVVEGKKIAEGTIKAGSTGNPAKATETFTWEWPYEVKGESADEAIARDAQDTDDGKKAGKFKVTYKIDAVQVKPAPDE